MGWQVWGDLLRWSDVIVFVIMYVATGLGVTVGFHRHFTHRSFKTSKPVRATLAVLGSVAIEGPIISWVADHRKHHTFSDQDGDPHSPHVGHGGGFRGALKGLAHAHVGWLFIHTQRGARKRYARDLIDDPVIELRGPHLPVLGGGRPAAGLRARLRDRRLARTPRLTGLLWGGAVRHARGAPRDLQHQLALPLLRPAALRDRGRVAQPVLARAATFGESWHNNHHAFPTSAMHGMRRWEIDPSALVIRGLEKLGPGLGRGADRPGAPGSAEAAGGSSAERCQAELRSRSVRTLTAFGPLSPG